MFGLTAAKQNTQIKKLTLLFIVCCIFAKILVYHAHSSGSLYTRLQTLCKNQASHPNRCHLLKTTCAAKRKPAGYQRVSIKWSGEREEPTLSHSVQNPIKRQPSKPIGNYLLPEPGCSFYRFYYDGIEFCRFLPDKFIQMVEDEYDYRYFEDVNLHIGLASAFFAGIYAGLMAQAQTSGSGGGGQSSSGWGRKKDEDDERWARRAIALANGIRPKKSKSTSRKY